MNKAPYTAFGVTKMVPVVVWFNNKQIDSDWWTEDLWVERAEDWYALMSSQLKEKRVRVIDADVWRRSSKF
jgi:hypothetical protein